MLVNASMIPYLGSVAQIQRGTYEIVEGTSSFRWYVSESSSALIYQKMLTYPEHEDQLRISATGELHWQEHPAGSRV